MYTFTQALKAALPHTAKGKETPLLQSMLINDEGVWATDRYTVIHVPFVEQHLVTTPFLLGRDDATTLSKQKSELLGLAYGSLDAITFQLSGSAHTLHSCSLEVSTYPNVSRLFDRFKPSTSEGFDVDPKHMEKFALRHLGKGVSLRLSTSEYGKAFRVVGWSGEVEFTALVQPLRSSLQAG